MSVSTSSDISGFNRPAATATVSGFNPSAAPATAADSTGRPSHKGGVHRLGR